MPTLFRSTAGRRRFVFRSALVLGAAGALIVPEIASANHGDDARTQASDNSVVDDVSTPDSTEQSSTPATTDDSSTPTTTEDSSTPVTTDDSSTPDTTEDSSTPATTEDSSTPDTTDDSTPTTVEDDDDVLPMAPFTQTYNTTGGSVTVNFDGNALTLAAVSPAPGFVIERQEARPDRVRVRFESDDDRSEIEVGFHDGELREEVEDD